MLSVCFKFLGIQEEFSDLSLKMSTGSHSLWQESDVSCMGNGHNWAERTGQLPLGHS